MFNFKRVLSNVGQMLDAGEEIEVTVAMSRLDKRFRRRYAFILLLTAAVGIFLVPQVQQLAGIDIEPPLVAAGFVFPFIVLVLTELRHLQKTYHFTDRKLIEENGLLNKDFHTVPYQKITKISVDQRVFDRMVGIGDIHINVMGTDEAGMVLYGVRNPKKIRSLISGYHDLPGGDAGQTGQAQAAQPQPVDAEPVPLSKTDLEAEMGRVQRRRNELEERYDDGEITEEEYSEQWYKLLGEEQLLERQLDRLEKES